MVTVARNDRDRVLGIDACKGGWVGVVLAGGTVSAHFSPSIADLVTGLGDPATIGVDMPIGLPDAGTRQADLLVARALGPRRASVFVTPVRAALEADDYATAIRLNRAATGAGVSAQAFALRTKIREVDRWVHQRENRVVEVHPELSFARMAGAPLPYRKTSWAGVELRRALLAGAGITLTGDLGEAGRMAAVDDVLDAAAAAWSAWRVHCGQASCYPEPPEVFSDGIPAAIWV
jgi:predicted RNase H-like nuclease